MEIRKYVILFLILGMSCSLILGLATGFSTVANRTKHFFHTEEASCVNQTCLPEDELKSVIIGAWGEDGIGNAEFAFYKDSLYYPDPNIWCNYNLVNDTIFIERDNSWTEKVLIVRLNEDSLELKYLDCDKIRVYAKRK